MSGVDWHKIRARLDELRRSFEQGAAPSAQRKAAVLRARAAALARPRSVEAADQDWLDLVEFIVAGERYAFESQYVRQVYPLKDLTALPGAPPFVLGIVNIRGLVVSVIDIKKFFGLPERGLTDLDKVIVLAQGAMAFGVLADRIVGVRRLSGADLQPSLPTLSGVREQYLKGVSAERLVVLAADKLLSDPAIVVREQAETQEELYE